MEESVVEALARNGVTVLRNTKIMGDKMVEKERAGGTVVRKDVDDEDMSTESLIAEIIRVLTPVKSENVHENIREKFSIIMPDGELRTLDLFPADTLKDYNKILDKRFGSCLLFGVKKHGVTKPPKIPYCVGMYNVDLWREQLSIVFRNNVPI